MINPLIFFLFAGIGLLLAHTLGKYKFSGRAAIVIALIYCGTPWLIGQKTYEGILSYSCLEQYSFLSDGLYEDRRGNVYSTGDVYYSCATGILLLAGAELLFVAWMITIPNGIKEIFFLIL